jgi:RNA polymerase sigma-70 factor (ECF subfamily)
MVEVDSGQTSPTLLGQIRDWGDHPAWNAFFERYNPLLRMWCHGFALESDESDELCQRIWIELMTRMRTFRYDPGRGFRRWLWRLFRSRAIDLMRARRLSRVHAMTELPFADSLSPPSNLRARSAIEDEERADVSSTLLIAASAAQEAVRSKVDPETWRGYWLIAIEDQTVREAADALGKRYTAVYNGYRRVERMLRLEGQRRIAAFSQQTSGSTELQTSCSSS